MTIKERKSELAARSAASVAAALPQDKADVAEEAAMWRELAEREV